MAGQIGRISASMATVHNENSAALATLNFDFALVKLEAPAEFNTLGATISRRRKVDAEEGALHKTARRLGGLFAELLPETDELFRAYGTRVSEISSMPSINPREGSDKAGIFASHIGIDSTSIWAAVTSGSAAIAVHLLACLLARMFSGPEAISLWVELVQKRKESIQSKQKNQLYSNEHIATIQAAKQDISRNDLARWDSSARAWLQSADEAKSFNNKQTMLIVNNANVPVNGEPDTYRSVIKAWITALEAMNNLLKGMPQRVHDGAALLGISSWHLYPDMVVYGGAAVEVKQKDPLFDRAALLTLGLNHGPNDVKSVHWSLPLACLQYYGHPVQASRSVGQDNSRITYNQFAFVLLGCIFQGWNTHSPTNDEGLQWFRILADILELPTEWFNSSKLKWLNFLINAVREFDESEVSEKRVANQLMNLGRRRSKFLYDKDVPSALFGLCELGPLLSVLKDVECQVRYLRRLVTHLNLDPRIFLIKYVKLSNDGSRFECASVEPVRWRSSKRTHDGCMKEMQSDPIHARWIIFDINTLELCYKRKEDLQNLPETEMKLEKLRATCAEYDKARDLKDDDSSSGPSFTSREMLLEISTLQSLLAIGRRREEIEKLGELCFPVLEYDPKNSTYSKYEYSSGTNNGEKVLIFSSRVEFMEAIGDILLRCEDHRTIRDTLPRFFFVGLPESAALIYLAYTFTPTKPTLGHSYLKDVLTTANIDKGRLIDYLSSTDEPEDVVVNEIAGLQACSWMAEVYHSLSGATISTLVLKQRIHRAKWTAKIYRPSGRHQWRLPHLYQTPDLPEAFACIAMFESGTCNLDPGTLSEVFAMSSGNSLYVAGALLCDPYEHEIVTKIRRVVGNIGRAGITFLISPPEVKMREADPEKWMAINHDRFDGIMENHFEQTSLHLSFTAYEIPLVTEEASVHLIDRDVTLLEALISVYEGGTWVAEVDILKALRSSIKWATPKYKEGEVGDKRLASHKSFKCRGMTYQESLKDNQYLAATSVVNWDELIEAPESGNIAVLAHKNWLARLAALAICSQKELHPIILGGDICWTCCADCFRENKNERHALIC